MGACASKPSHGKTGTVYETEAGVGANPCTFPASTAATKRCTTDVITNAFLAQEEAPQPEAAKGIAARLVSRRGPEDRRASPQSADLGIGPAPAAESLAGVRDGPQDIQTAKVAAFQRGPLLLTRREDSFDLARVETAKRIASMKRSFKGGASPAWGAFLSSDAGDAHDNSSSRWRPGSRDSGRGSDIAVGDTLALGDSGVRDIYADSRWRRTEPPEEEDVVPVGEDVGAGPEAPGAASVPALAEGGGAGQREALVFAAGGAGVGRGETCVTPRRDDPSGGGSGAGAGFRTFSISASRKNGAPRATGSGTAAAAGGGGSGGAAQAPDGSGGDGGGGLAGDATTATQMETDELRSLPLPNLVGASEDAFRGGGGGGGLGNGGGGGSWQRAAAASASVHRHSAAAYVQQQATMEPPLSGAAGVNRNSDLGYYLEEARFTNSTPLQGARPVRHNLLDCPMVRQRADKAARDAAETEARPTPVVLEYVPSVIRSQPSRGNLLLAQPSQRQRLLLDDDNDRSESHAGGVGGVGSVSAVTSRRLEYMPSKAVSRKFTTAAAPQSGSQLLGPGSCSRPLSHAASRVALTSPKVASTSSEGFFATSPRGTTIGGGDSERCFHVTRLGATAAAAAARGSGFLSVGGGLSGPAPVAASLLAGLARRAGDPERRVSSSASQVSLGSPSLEPSPSAPPLATATSRLGSDLHGEKHPPSRRAQRPMVPATLEMRASEPQLSSPPPSRLYVQKNGGGGGAKLSAVHEVLGSAVWNGPSSPPAAAVAAAPLTASGVGPRAVFSYDGHRGSDGLGGGDAVAVGSGALSSVNGVYSLGGGGRAAGRAARLLATLQRLGSTTAPEPPPASAAP